MSEESTDSAFRHEQYGHYNDTPHMEVDLTFHEWTEALKQVLEYKLGPPIAWTYKNNRVYLWGEYLDEDMKREISDACNELQQELSDDGFYSGADGARRAESKVHRAEIHQPGKATIEVD